MSNNDFDDFFEIDADGNVGKEKTETVEKPKTPQAPDPKAATPPSPPAQPTQPRAPSPSSPPSPSPPPQAAQPKVPPAVPPPQSSPPPPAGGKGLDDKMMSGLGDFDALFEQAGKQAPIAPPADSNIDDLLSDFGGGAEGGNKTQIQPPKPSAPPSPPPPKASSIPKASPPKPPSKSELSKPEEALEELFSEVSQSDALPAEPSGEVLAAGLGVDTKKKKKWIKSIVMGVGGLVLFVGLVAVITARVSSNGFLGWKWGQKPADGYEAPSSRVLKQLAERYSSTQPLLQNDRFEDYKKVETELSSILKIDSRNSPTDAKLAEVLLIMGDKTVAAQVRKTIASYITQSEKFHPEIIETLRAKARAQLADGQYPQAETVGKKALSVGAQDIETLTLLGEISLSRGDLDQAAQYFNQALQSTNRWPRAKHFLALTRLQQGNVDEAESILKELAFSEPNHPSSEVEYWRLTYAQRGRAEEAKEGIKKLVETRNSSLSGFDLGKAWKTLAEISESQKDMKGAISAMEKASEVDRASHGNAYYLGRLYLSEKQFEKAANEFSRASSLSPTNAEYLVYEGNALREMGKFAESLTELQKALEKEPLNIEGLYQLGLTQRALTRNDEAISSFENVLKSDSRHIDAMNNLGELYLARDNFAMAKSHLKTAINIAPRSVRAHNNMGRLLLINRKFDEALQEFKLAEAEDPTNVDVLSNMGRAYLALDNTAKAASYFEKALSLDPSLLETQVATGELQHKKKDYVKAVDIYRNVLKVRPKDYDTRVKLAAVLIDQQSFQESVQELQEASKWSPNYYPTRLHLGIAWRGLGNLDASIEQLQIALQLRPEAAEAHYQVEMTHIFRNDPINAESSMDKALSFDPKYIDPLVSLGDYYDGRNLYGKAVVYYLRAEKIQPHNSEVLLKVAESYRKEGENKKKAKEYYAKTLGANRKVTAAYVGLSLLEEDAGHDAKAIAYLKQAQKIDPNDPKPYYYLGFLYKDTPNKKAAILAFRKYLQLDPQTKEKKDIEDQIYQLMH